MGDAKWATDAISSVNDCAREELCAEIEATSVFITKQGLQHGDFLINGVVHKGALKTGQG